MRALKKNRIKINYEPSLKASSIRAYVEPILKLLIASINTDIFENLENNNDLIDISIINNIINARNIVLTALSNRKDIKLLVK